MQLAYFQEYQFPIFDSLSILFNPHSVSMLAGYYYIIFALLYMFSIVSVMIGILFYCRHLR